MISIAIKRPSLWRMRCVLSEKLPLTIDQYQWITIPQINKFKKIKTGKFEMGWMMLKKVFIYFFLWKGNLKMLLEAKLPCLFVSFSFYLLSVFQEASFFE